MELVKAMVLGKVEKVEDDKVEDENVEEEKEWQLKLKKVKDRNSYLLKSGKFTDCRFGIGPVNNTIIFSAHRLFLSMASPVFERLLQADIYKENDLVSGIDVQPDAFKALLEYIYNDNIPISSFENACDLYCAAKKYQIVYVMEQCIEFVVSNLSPKLACRAYEFGQEHQEQRLTDSSLKYIVNRTREVTNDEAFMDVKPSTLMTIFEQEQLNIFSELELYHCLRSFAIELDKLKEEKGDTLVVHPLRYHYVEKSENDEKSVNDTKSEDDAKSENEGKSKAEAKAKKQEVLVYRNGITEDVLRQVVKKIRFLAMTPQEFAQDPAISSLLTIEEAFAIFLHISNPSNYHYEMPNGFSLSRENRCSLDNIQRYCLFAPKRYASYEQTSSENSSITFRVDKTIYIMGVGLTYRSTKFPISNGEFYMSLSNTNGAQIANTESSKINGLEVELILKKPFRIEADNYYTINVTKPLSIRVELSFWEQINKDGVTFSFNSNKEDYTAIDAIYFSI